MSHYYPLLLCTVVKHSGTWVLYWFTRAVTIVLFSSELKPILHQHLPQPSPTLPIFKYGSLIVVFLSCAHSNGAVRQRGGYGILKKWFYANIYILQDTSSSSCMLSFIIKHVLFSPISALSLIRKTAIQVAYEGNNPYLWYTATVQQFDAGKGRFGSHAQSTYKVIQV